MKCLAIIPARGGSKGIPRKNIRPLAGKPLLAYNIEAARASRYIQRVVVSTDDPEIARVAQQSGAEVVWRPAEISGDNASSESALLYTLTTLQNQEAYAPELLVFLQCTSPLTLAEDIDGTITALLDQDADSALAVIPFHYFLWQRGVDSAGQPDASGINHTKTVRPLRQEREPQYLETGAVYVMRVPGFQQAQHRFFGRTALYEMPGERRLEIDDPVDFQVAEVLIAAQRQTRQLERLPKPVKALVIDFDGVFTDNTVIVNEDGREAVICSRSDGWGISQLRKTGLQLLILSTETNPVVQARADKLKIPCLHGLSEKGLTLQNWLVEQQIDPAYVVYLGNDQNDLTCMAQVGCAVAVADAHPEALAQADIILSHTGGNGAVRELCELILKSTGTI
ncbi:MAG TPA: acylneuraminate cytidylyltransferase [Anaerolineales bacterium]|nr:acylneuraminate cytidylyltransferase [Anaerolineales bacterium]